MDILGFFVTPTGGRRYFIQKPQHVHNKALIPHIHEATELAEMSEGQLQRFACGLAVIEPVYQNADCPPFLITKDLLGKLGVFYTRWSPLSPVPLEHDHLGRARYLVVDFAMSVEEAVSIVQRWQ